MPEQADGLERLAAIIVERAAAEPGQSYTAKLLAAGPPLCAKKFGEEAVELVIAAVSGDKQRICAETADVLYHLLVTLRAADVALEEVMAELQRREAQGGLAEKASRRP